MPRYFRRLHFELLCTHGLVIIGAFGLLMGAAEQGVILVFDHGAHKGRHLRSGQQQRDGMHLEHVFAWVFEQKLTRKLFAGGDIVREFFRALVKPSAKPSPFPAALSGGATGIAASSAMRAAADS